MLPSAPLGTLKPVKYLRPLLALLLLVSAQIYGAGHDHVDERVGSLDCHICAQWLGNAGVSSQAPTVAAVRPEQVAPKHSQPLPASPRRHTTCIRGPPLA